MCEFYTISKKGNKWVSEPLKELTDFSTIPGVWFVLGKETSDDKFICLDVAETGDIRNEITIDIGFTNFDYSKLKMDYEAYNKLGKYMFTCNHKHFRECLWSYTKTHYPNLRFIIINKEIDDKDTRRDLERYIAYKYNAIFWRDSRPYVYMDSERKKQIITDNTNNFEKENPNYKSLDLAIKSLIK